MYKSYFKTVYVVGNGLDLSCGFKTSYFDFMESLTIQQKNKNNLMRHLSKTYSNQGWIDLEIELKNYSNRLKKGLNPNWKEYQESFEDLKMSLYQYLSKINFSSQQNIKNFELMKGFVKEYELLYILNFNYSNTIEEYLELFSPKLKNQIKINHIHGTLKGNDIIIGVQDDVDLPKGANFLYKSRHVNPQQIANIAHVLKEADTIVFFGYSLGETDHSYFDFLFETQSANEATSKNFIFYHYGDDARNELDYNLRMLTKKNLNHFYANNNVEFKDCKN